jgi:RimJ/RimL family protein N-acetyltransferase
MHPQATMTSLPAQLECERLLLRRWRHSDRVPFAAMNADVRVMEYFPHRLSVCESDALVNRIQKHFDDHGYGLWAVEVRSGPPFIGFIGLAIPRFETHFTPCVEIGWRLDANHWGKGYATEGAQAALDFGFIHSRLTEIVSMTTVANSRSRRVMEKIGMIHSQADDFDHPLLPDGHPLKRHVLYRLRRADEQVP